MAKVGKYVKWDAPTLAILIGPQIGHPMSSPSVCSRMEPSKIA
jgi:hypothetical protein